ncbi:MAG: ABC transporter substrate-binding protein, partial [Bdellovibrionales bacterium]
MHLPKRLVLTALLLASPAALDVAPAMAAANSAQTHEQAVAMPVGKFIQDLGNQAIAVIADKSLSKEQQSEKFRSMLQASFDLQTVGRFVIGRSWNAASPTQTQEDMKLFEALVVQTSSDRGARSTG